MPRRRVWALLALGLAGVSSAAVLAAVVIGEDGSPVLGVTIGFWRCLGGGLALAPWALRARRTHPVARDDARRLGVAGVALALHFALFLGSIAWTSVASAATFATTSAVFVALGGIAYLHERPDRRTWCGIAVTIAGAVAIGAGDLGAEDLGPLALAGDVLALASAAFISVYLLVGRRVRSRIHTATFSSVVYLVAAAALLPTAWLVGAPLVDLTGTQWWAVLGIVVGPQLLGHTILTTLLSSVRAAVIGVVVLAEPVIATLLAWVFLGELPATAYWFAAPVVLTGVALATIRPGARPRGAPRAAGSPD